MFTKRQLIRAVIVTIIIAIVVFMVIPYLVTQKSFGWTYGDKTGVIGDTIGGIVGPVVAFIGAVLTFLAFFIQYQANQIQIKALNDQRDAQMQSDRQNKIQQIENNFIELLKFHRGNVNEMNYRLATGRNVFVKMLNEFKEALDIVRNSNIITENNVKEQDIANISYLVVFFGVDESTSDALKNRIYQHYGNFGDKIFHIINKLRDKRAPISDEKHYFNGHQSRLGHYFRHLYGAVNYIHEDEILNRQEKEKYLRLLRSQLSTQEQILFFFNSISDLGLSWELGANVLPENKLISSYNLIRNVPLGLMYGFNPKKYYPNLKLENDFER